MADERNLRKQGKSRKPGDSYLKFRTRWRHVLRIDQEIRAGRAPNCRQLAEELEVCRRTILRDIDFMKYDLGAPIDYDPKRRGYVYTEPNWSIPSVRITEGELFALMVAEKALDAYAGTPWVEKLRRVFGRIIASLPDRIEVVPRELLARVDFDAGGAAEVQPGILEAVATAVSKNQTICIEYCPLGAGRPRQYKVDPYVLRRMRGAWYLAGRDCRSGHVPLFNLSRLRSVQPTGQRFDYEAAGFDPKAYFKSTFGAFETGQVHHIKVEFTGVAAELVRERKWHASQKLKDLSGGRLRFEADVSHLDDVWPWVLSWGRDAKAVAPRELVKIVSRQAQQAAAQYRHKKTGAGRTR